MTQASEELLRLAERCEAATGPSFDLFAEAFEAVHGGRSGEGFAWSNFCALIETDAWLDAAMTLVPEGHESVPVCVLLDAINANCEDAWVAALPRYVAAAALRAHANKATPHG